MDREGHDFQSRRRICFWVEQRFQRCVRGPFPETALAAEVPELAYPGAASKRLLRFLVALDQDMQIVVKPHHDRKNAPALQVF
jgi:hypothetical protein